MNLRVRWALAALLAAGCSPDEVDPAPPIEGNELPPDGATDDDAATDDDTPAAPDDAADDTLTSPDAAPEDVFTAIDVGMDATTTRPDVIRDVSVDLARSDSTAAMDAGARMDVPVRTDVPMPRDTGAVPVPVPGTVRPGATCHTLLRDLGVRFTVGPAARGVEDPVTVTTPIEGVHYRYASFTAAERPLLMDCRLGVALVRMSRQLRDQWNIDTVEHIGIYNYRVIAGTTRLSQHAYAMAIDLGGFRNTAGQTFSVLTDFTMNGSPTCPPRATSARDRTLKEIACWLYSSRTFNIILTPNYNADHRNHFHVDLTAGSHFIGFDRPEGVDPEPNGLTDFLIDDE